ncbi:hypothetical protein SAMN05421767_10422 [Granulicatella balaenopterae]|uniref:Uncharacterized protein n=1 Tax=Granulicatella balaenopterae TaxID=137733 RepID=A0A1H9I157_9LACT|nr:hypothetical protein [Granulicatella balaenopterae]SEQ68297.1 hypothetical protein SAMN05421767_10422 [Granulicatella balaenopterae]
MGLDQNIYIIKQNKEYGKDERYGEEFYYFRKVNSLQGFFEEKFNIDNCEYIEIDEDTIDDIITRCKVVLEYPKLADDVFPTTEGFFYGRYDYNQSYFEDVKDVYNCFSELKKLLNQLEKIYYTCWY